MRIGTGYDAHRLVPNRPLVLGGVHIPHHVGLAGHSDADVLIHAIIDALLGASRLGDIGALFPPDDAAYLNIASTTLLERVCDLLADYRVVNIDSTVIAQQPRLAPFLRAMEANIAACLQIDVGQVSVKATTEENMGFTGSCEGIAAQAVCLIQRNF